MSTTHVPAALRELVAFQAGHRCGYCLTAEQVIGTPMEIDHLIPEARGGLTVEENLWLACSGCNAYKGDHADALDPLTGEIVALYNPRRQQWQEHFAWTSAGDLIVGQTPTGRATVTSLKLNRPLLVRARRLWVRIGVHPP
ncbi:MAG: HNH endonuclease [Chloroflexota bacterium]